MAGTIPRIVQKLPIVFLKERQRFIAYCPALDLSASGESLAKAKDNFQTVLRLFINDLIERGTLRRVLEEMGWIHRRDEWMPPTMIKRIYSVSLTIPLPD